MIKIKAQKFGTLSENDRLELAKLLVKAGYTVRIGKEKNTATANARYEYFVEAKEAGE